MPPEASPVEYLLPDGLDPAELESRLVSKSGFTAEGQDVLERTLLDTFDWRLFHAGTGAEQSTGVGSQFRWYRLADRQELHRLPAPAPRFSWELPPGVFRRELAQRIEMRALLPKAHLRCQTTHLALRNKQQKVVLRLCIEKHTLLGGAALPLRPRLRLEPVRGYPKALARAVRKLIAPLELESSRESLLSEALAALQVVPATYSSKVRVTLTPDMPAGAAARTILLRLLDTMEANEAGTLADTDSEFLHDFRVAVRRTRSALGQLKQVLPSDVLERFREEFAWLGTITTPTRDIDVYLLDFPRYQASLPPEVRADLNPLREFLRVHQRREHQTLVQALASKRYRSLKRDWRGFLETVACTGSEPADAQLPILALARKRIWRTYSRVLKEGGALNDDSPAELFHELRKTCKKLRYLLEFFQSLFPPKKISAIVGALKTIQDNLGMFNDLEIQADAMSRFGRLMRQEGGAPVECLLAMGMLVEDLNRRQVATRSEFAERFTAFSGSATRKNFRKVFAPSKTGTKKAGTR